MDSQPIAPKGDMDVAGDLLNSGKTEEALLAYNRIAASQIKNGRTINPEVLQMIGVCYRMLKNYIQANVLFALALVTAESDEQGGKILRDWSMAFLEQMDFATALDALSESLRLLHGHPREHAATLGYIGRVYGKQGHRLMACDYHHIAHEIFRGLEKAGEPTSTYQLNNLVWWLKVESKSRLRLQLSRQAWHLAAAARNRKRQLQIGLLLLCRPLTTHILDR